MSLCCGQRNVSGGGIGTSYMIIIMYLNILIISYYILLLYYKHLQISSYTPIYPIHHQRDDVWGCMVMYRGVW